MPFEPRPRTRPTFTAAFGLGLALALSGCALAAPRTPDAAPRPSEQAPAEAVAPWGDDDTPRVMIEFERDGAMHTVAGEIPFGLASCGENGLIAIGSKSPDPGVGVLFSFEADTPIPVSVWIVGDEYAAQVPVKEIVTATQTEGAGTSYTLVGASGTASVLLRDVNKFQIGEYDFGPEDQVEATASFLVTCPAG